MRSPLKNLRRAQNRKRKHPRPREMDTSRIEVKAPAWDAASALSQIFRGLLDPAARSTKFQGVVVVGDLRVDRRELVHLEFDLVAVSKSPGGHAGGRTRGTLLVKVWRARLRHSCVFAAAFARCCRSRGGFVSSRGGGGTRRGWQLFKVCGGLARRAGFTAA